MPTDATPTPIEDLIRDGALLINDGYRAKNSELSSIGMPFARAGNINDGFKFEDADRVPSETLAKVGNKRSKPGDVVFTSKGTVGRFAYVREDTPEFVYSPQLCFWRSGDPSRIDSNWLYYWMNGREFFEQFKGVAGQTDMAEYVSLRDQRAMKITLPPLPEQKAIARILGTLDDKIELNRRMNATLEAMARALFQSWFVDFDPVHAKAAGRQPSGMDAPTAALFPESFQASDLGEIPEGWRVGVFDELIDFVIGGDWGANDATPEANVPCHCIRGADIPSLQEGGLGKMPIRYLKPSSVAKRGLQSGDLAIEISGGSPTQCTGRPVLISDGILESLGTPLVASNFCRIVKLKSPAFSKFAYLWIRSLYDAGLLFQFETGTTGIKNFGFVRFAEAHQLIIPESKTLAAFDTTVAPLFARIQANAAQSRTLATLRDTLLPKLLSGELPTT
jgi:type I restriction enzyme S subunit